MERHLPYGITQSYLLPDTGERTRLNRNQAGRYSIHNIPHRDRRPGWLVIYGDSSPVRGRRGQLCIQVVTGPGRIASALMKANELFHYITLRRCPQ